MHLCVCIYVYILYLFIYICTVHTHICDKLILDEIDSNGSFDSIIVLLLNKCSLCNFQEHLKIITDHKLLKVSVFCL